MNIKLYRVKDEYIDFLRKYDEKVLFNKNQKRPYIGIVFKINDCKFYAPLSSPKDKHKSMKNTIDFHKLDGGKLGAINLNNMIPVKDSEIIHYDINKIADKKYRELLRNQLKFIKTDSQLIKSKAKKLYYKTTNFKVKISARCVDFKRLEKIIELEWNKENFNKSREEYDLEI